MKNKIFTYCEIDKQGNFLNVLERDKFKECLALAFEGKQVKITVEEVYPKKTMPQIAYYKCVVVKFCEIGLYQTTGEVVFDGLADLMLKELFLKAPSIAEADVSEMSEFIDESIKFIYEYFSIRVPEADKDWKLKLSKNDNTNKE